MGVVVNVHASKLCANLKGTENKTSIFLCESHGKDAGNFMKEFHVHFYVSLSLIGQFLLLVICRVTFNSSVFLFSFPTIFQCYEKM